MCALSHREHLWRTTNMFRTELLLILPLVVAVTVGQANRGYSYYGTSNVRDQRPQPINGQRPLLLPGRPMTVTGPVTVAPVAPAPVLGPSAPAATPSTTAPSYAPLPRPRPLYTPVYRPLLPPRPIRPAPPGVTPPQSSAIGEPLPPVTESAPPLQPVKPNTLEAPILPEPAVEQPEPAPIPILPSQTGEPVVVEPVPEPVPIGEPAPFAEQSTAPELIQPSAVVSQPIPQPEPIRQPEPESQPEPIWQPEPEPQPEPIRQPEPEPQPEPIRQPEPEPQPEPIRQPESEPQPEPIREPQLGPIRQPEPEPQPEPIRQPDPEPQPEPIRQPKLEPQTEPIRQPEPVLIPEPIPQPEPIPEPELVQQSELALQPEYYPPPEPTQEIVQAQEPAVIPEREAVPFLEPLPKPVPSLKLTSTAGSINVPQSPTPVALLPLLPKHHPVRELVFSRHPQSSVSPMIYYPTITYPTQTPAYPYFPTPPRPVPTQAPPVVVTTLSHPAVTQTSGQLKFDFHCKEGNGYYSVEHECDTYIECKQNRVMKYACPDGLHFNPAAKHYEYPCAYPSEVKCITGDQEQNPKPTDKCPNQYGFYSMNDGDCSTFIMCQEGLATIMNCSMGLAFNPQTSSCDWPANVPQCNPNIFKDFVCPDPPEDEDGQVSEIIYKYRYEGQCKLYIACQLGHPRLLSCGRGLSFDDASQACIDEEYVTDCTVPNIYRY